jgi:hypothetical protein
VSVLEFKKGVFVGLVCLKACLFLLAAARSEAARLELLAELEAEEGKVSADHVCFACSRILIRAF